MERKKLREGRWLSKEGGWARTVTYIFWVHELSAISAVYLRTYLLQEVKGKEVDHFPGSALPLLPAQGLRDENNQRLYACASMYKHVHTCHEHWHSPDSWAANLPWSPWAWSQTTLLCPSLWNVPLLKCCFFCIQTSVHASMCVLVYLQVHVCSIFSVFTLSTPWR